jgi:hypothetical protein
VGQFEASFVGLSGVNASIIPNAASVAITVSLDASPFYVLTTVTQSSTLTQVGLS